MTYGNMQVIPGGIQSIYHGRKVGEAGYIAQPIVQVVNIKKLNVPAAGASGGGDRYR